MKPGPKVFRSIPRLPARKTAAHKGDFGRVLVIGGSAGMIGAPALAASAALRSGAGLVTVGVPERIQLAVAGLTPCATSIPLRCTPSGWIDEDGSRIADQLARMDVVAFGPGLGHGDGRMDETWYSLLRVLSMRPVVLDADGLNLLSRLPSERRRVPGSRWVLTPHPGEMGALLGVPAGEVQADRRAAVLRCHEQLGGGELVVVLKGKGTVVSDGARIYINRTGNPGMATGGTGDVLTGVIAALIGQGLGLFEAAVLGVHVHGLAGDLAARRLGQIPLMATDLLDSLPGAFRRAAGRRQRTPA